LLIAAHFPSCPILKCWNWAWAQFFSTPNSTSFSTCSSPVHSHVVAQFIHMYNFLCQHAFIGPEPNSSIPSCDQQHRRERAANSLFSYILVGFFTHVHSNPRSPTHNNASNLVLFLFSTRVHTFTRCLTSCHADLHSRRLLHHVFCH